MTLEVVHLVIWWRAVLGLPVGVEVPLDQSFGFAVQRQAGLVALVCYGTCQVCPFSHFGGGSFKELKHIQAHRQTDTRMCTDL